MLSVNIILFTYSRCSIWPPPTSIHTVYYGGCIQNPSGCLEQNGRPIQDPSETLPLVFVFWINPKNFSTERHTLSPVPVGGTLLRGFSGVYRRSLVGTLGLHRGLHTDSPVDDRAPTEEGGNFLVFHWMAPFRSATEHRGCQT